jgi:hypothetical protein
MAQSRNAPTQLPPILIALASLIILAHLGAVVVHALAAPSGPWGPPDSGNIMPSPRFAESLDRDAAQPYLAFVRLSDAYRFSSEQPAVNGVFLEVNLRDAKGEVVKTVRFPKIRKKGEDTPPPPPDFWHAWIRERQEAFVRGLVDQSVAPPEGEKIAAPGQRVVTVPIWEMTGEFSSELRTVPEHLIPRNRQVFRPTPWSLVLVHSYARYLCQANGADSAEVIRHMRAPSWPLGLARGQPPEPPMFTDLVANYGVIKLDERNASR